MDLIIPPGKYFCMLDRTSASIPPAVREAMRIGDSIVAAHRAREAASTPPTKAPLSENVRRNIAAASPPIRSAVTAPPAPRAKSYAEMTAGEKHILKHSDPELFERLRAEDRGASPITDAQLRARRITRASARAYADMTAGEKHALKRDNPELFAALREAHHITGPLP